MIEKVGTLPQKVRIAHRPVIRLKRSWKVGESPHESQSAQALEDKLPSALPKVTPEERRRMISDAAYYRAEKDGFAPDPVDVWLAAEREIDALLFDGHTNGQGTELLTGQNR